MTLKARLTRIIRRGQRPQYRANTHKFLTAIGPIARMEVSFCFLESYHLASDERVALAKLILQPFKSPSSTNQIPGLVLVRLVQRRHYMEGEEHEWPSMEPAEKEEYEQYVWDLAASFKNAAPSRRGASTVSF